MEQRCGSCVVPVLLPPYLLTMGSWLSALLCPWQPGFILSAPAQCLLPFSSSVGAWVQVWSASNSVRVGLVELMCPAASLGRSWQWPTHSLVISLAWANLSPISDPGTQCVLAPLKVALCHGLKWWYMGRGDAWLDLPALARSAGGRGNQQP